jgi:hypothetical protein
MTNVVKFPFSVSRRVYSRRPRKSINGTPDERAVLQEIVAEVVEEIDARASARALSATAENFRLRIARRDAWWRAGRVTDYWRARMDWNHALSLAQSHGIGNANSYPSIENEDRLDLVDKWREAVVKQLLTPAPDGAAVTWKRAKLAGRGFRHLPTKPERIERVIADDVAFLEAHPTRAKRGTS